jgi:hypothetical protein
MKVSRVNSLSAMLALPVEAGAAAEEAAGVATTLAGAALVAAGADEAAGVVAEGLAAGAEALPEPELAPSNRAGPGIS